MSAPRPAPQRSSTIVCVGGGISAIALGARLKSHHNFDDLTLYERDTHLGGTWHANSYPGAACDIPTALYSFSFAQNPEWTVLHPPSGEIKAYVEKVAQDYGLVEKTTFRTEAFRAEWDDKTNRWYVWVRNLDSGDEYVHECKILFSATGLLVDPMIPQIPGQEKFEGAAMHSSRWDHSVSLEGKNVAIIGNGCTAAQIVPAIAPKVKSLTQFIRSKHWIQKAIDIEYTPKIRWFLRNVPLAQRLHRFAVFLAAEWDYRLQGASKYSAKQRAAKMKEVEAYMRSKAPARFHDLLIPDFQIGCKRRIMDPGPGYLESLNNEHVMLTDEKVVELTSNSIRTPTRDYPVDVIVYATGFQTGSFMSPMEVFGRGGESLTEHWSRLGGPGAYNCTALHGFPNFFFILGPNTATGHTSCILASENTVMYALKVAKPILDGYASTVEPKEEAEKAYVKRVQDELQKSNFSKGGCSSWYKSAKDGWNATMYPWSQVHFYYTCKFVKWKDWTTTYTRRRPVSKWLWFGALLALVGGILGYPRL
ncbi:dimethylaniline monooxygenase [Sphaerosporella brunnea]|uniref:Dimethylaniline monooxygenase n=1 Tax=Sphaerosporella brunnea TaxID=1250544 RepID=A0A5J5ESA5_9PEZI|nr:dimethylaniline monooxygenase [Sphaerosporella brunnea]